MIAPIFLTLLIIAVAYFLYSEGIGTCNMKFSLMDMTSFDGCRSRFSSCSGYMKRVVRFKEDRIYRFDLTLSLSKGDFFIELLDPNGNAVLKLDKDTPTTSAEVSSGVRYRLVFRFRSASGSYKLSWD